MAFEAAALPHHVTENRPYDEPKSENPVQPSFVSHRP